jgi:hypothetical protein
VSAWRLFIASDICFLSSGLRARLLYFEFGAKAGSRGDPTAPLPERRECLLKLERRAAEDTRERRAILKSEKQLQRDHGDRER